MKRPFILCFAIGTVLFFMGFVAGQLLQHSKTGYHYEVRAEKEFASPMGPVHWSYVTESIGSPFLDPGTTIIKLGNRTIYKAQRYFQESVPFADNIVTSDKSVAWDDGEFQFHLTVEPMKKSEQDGQTNSSQRTEWDRQNEVAAVWVRDADVVVETVAVPTGSVRVVRPSAASRTNIVVPLRELEARVGQVSGSMAVVVVPKILDLQNITNVVTALRGLGCAPVRVVVEGWGQKFPGPEI